MFAKRPIRYAEKIERKKARNRILIYITVFMILCIIIRTFIFQTWKIRGDLMKPTLRDGDIVIVVPCLLFAEEKSIGIAGLPKKGDVVLVGDGSEFILPSIAMIKDSVLRFITLQKYSLLATEFGKTFSLPAVMRIQGIQQEKNNLKTWTVFKLATDSQGDNFSMTGSQIVLPSRIKGRVVLRIWPLARIGKVQ